MMTKIYLSSLAQKQSLAIYDFCIYEKQMPEVRKKLHEVIRQLVDQKEVTILALSKELICERGKIYRMYYGWDIDSLPQRWSEHEDRIIREQYQKKTYNK